MDSLITPAALAMVGQERPRRTGIVTPRHIRQFCAAIDHLDPAYLAGDDAIAPPLYAQAATRPVPTHAELLGDGQFDDLAPPGLQDLQSILAGQDWTFDRPVRAGQRLVEQVSIGKIEERSGRNGPMVFVDEIARLTTEAGEPVLSSVNHLIFRPHPPTAGPKTADRADMSCNAGKPMTTVQPGSLTKRPDMVALFMFDAAIWGTHRIHWDAEYARSEGLPAPVLPGWMMASYLAEFALREAGGARSLASLSVRYRAFAHAGDELTCTGVSQGKALDMAMVNQAGVTVIDGTASFA